MAKIITIAMKEFSDNVSDKSFLLCSMSLLVAMVGGAFYFVQYVQDWTLWADMLGDQIVEGTAWKFNYQLITAWITSQLSSLGVLLAISLSFNSISKERKEGSLKVLLSYPVYRDKVILGKLLAGFLVIALVTTTSMAVSFSIVAFYLSIPLTLDFLLRVAATTAAGVTLLTFFLCLGIAASTVLRDTSTILLSLILASTLLRFDTIKVLVVAALNLLSLLQGRGPYNRNYMVRWTDPFYRTYSRLSPVESFQKLSERLFNYGSSFEYSAWVEPGYKYASFHDQLYGNLDLLAVPVLFAVASFIISYILFMRRDIA